MTRLKRFFPRGTLWVYDEYGSWNLRFVNPDTQEEVHAFIQPRPAYCDRGHWCLNIDARRMNLDGADCFPRYYMDLETAKAETEAFLIWRLWKVPFDQQENML